jgi:hypothetical protein
MLNKSLISFFLMNCSILSSYSSSPLHSQLLLSQPVESFLCHCRTQDFNNLSSEKLFGANTIIIAMGARSCADGPGPAALGTRTTALCSLGLRTE